MYRAENEFDEYLAGCLKSDPSPQPTLRLQLNQNEAIDRKTSFRVLGLTIYSRDS